MNTIIISNGVRTYEDIVESSGEAKRILREVPFKPNKVTLCFNVGEETYCDYEAKISGFMGCSHISIFNQFIDMWTHVLNSGRESNKILYNKPLHSFKIEIYKPENSNLSWDHLIIVDAVKTPEDLITNLKRILEIEKLVIRKFIDGKETESHSAMFQNVDDYIDFVNKISYMFEY